MTPNRMLPIPLLGAAFLAGCGGAENPADILDRLERCTSEQGPPDAYCGTIEVWEDRQLRTGRRISLKVVVLPGFRRAGNPNPLFFLAGGPGEGAAQGASRVQQAFRPLMVDRDIVLVDQRGTGESNSLACEFNEDNTLESDPEGFARLLRECMGGFDADLRLYTTPIAMDDLNEVRESLGYGRINLYGGSYGTRAAIVYARRYPETVRSIVLDSVAPPGLILPLYFARDGQRAFDLLAEDCLTDPLCAEAFPNLAARFEQLLARLDRNPERITMTHPRTGEPGEIRVNRFLISGIVFAALYQPETTSVLPFLIDRATEGDYSGLLAMGSLGAGVIEEMSMGMRYSVVCAEDAPRVDDDAILRETGGTFAGATLAEAFLRPCEFWPRGDIPEDYATPFASEAPTLLLSGEFDPVTPPAWAAEIADAWPNTRHVVVPGIGHGTATRGCLMRVVRQFLNDADPQTLDPTCTETLHRKPFFLGYAGPLAPEPGTTQDETNGDPP